MQIDALRLYNRWVLYKSMLIKTVYSNPDTERKLNDRFGFIYYDQDWDLINANANRVSEFTGYFLETEDQNELISLFDLIIASVDDLDNDKEQRNYLSQIHNKVVQHKNQFMPTIIYWSQIGSGINKDSIWSVTPLIRSLLDELTKTESFKIKCPEIYCIELAGEELLNLISKKQAQLTFEELIDRANHSNKINFSKYARLEIEVCNCHVVWSIYPQNGGAYLYKFHRDDYMNEIKRYKT